jgi:RimJ/RimL family protein N-acetyltransferase
MLALRPMLERDADLLHPMLVGSSVTDTILWDGPASLEDYRRGLAEREAAVRAGSLHIFTIVLDGEPIGSIDVRPDEDAPFRGDLGFWIGEPFQGRGHGTAAIRLAVAHAFGALALVKLEASVFVGNHASRRALEKAGFQLEGTIRRYRRKRGQLVDSWLLGLIPGEQG